MTLHLKVTDYLVGVTEISKAVSNQTVSSTHNMDNKEGTGTGSNNTKPDCPSWS